MQTRTFVIKAAQGLHARPCANLAATVRKCADNEMAEESKEDK